MRRELDLSEQVTDKRSRSVVVTCKPSRLAHDFIKTTCGSLSGYESGYTSDTSVATAASSSTLSSSDQQDITTLDEEARERVFSSSPPQRPKLSRAPREMTVYPSLPLRYRKGRGAHARVKKTSSITNLSEIGSNEDSPTHSSSIAEVGLLSTSLPSLIAPEEFRSKSPSVLLTRPNKPIQKRKVQTIGSPMRSVGHQKLFVTPSFEENISFLSGPTISSPVRIRPEPSHSNAVEERRLCRAYAIKRRSLLDLGISQMASDVSA